MKLYARVLPLLMILTLTFDVVWSIRKDIGTLIRNRYLLPLTNEHGRHHATRDNPSWSSGRHRPAPGRIRVNPTFVAQFKGLMNTLQHHAA